MGREKGERVRVALFGNSSWYLWNFRAGLAVRLAEHGCQVVFMAPVDSYSKRLEQLGAFVPVRLRRNSLNPIREALSLLRVVRIIRRVQPDAVLTWTPKANIYGGLAGRVMRVPVLANISGLGAGFATDGVLAQGLGELYRLALRNCPLVFFQNGHDMGRFVEAGWTEGDRSRLLPGSGVDLERFEPSPMQDRDEVIFVYAARLLASKGLRELVSAARRLRREGHRLRVRVAGAYEETRRSAVRPDEVQAWEAEGVVQYLGHTDFIETVLSGADCVVLPSYYPEGIPRVLLEAAACGRPVITTDTPGCREAVDCGVSGLLCPPRDVPGLVDAMRKLILMSHDERYEMGLNGRARVEKSFSEERVLAAYLRALDRVLCRSSACQ